MVNKHFSTLLLVLSLLIFCIAATIYFFPQKFIFYHADTLKPTPTATTTTPTPTSIPTLTSSFTGITAEQAKAGVQQQIAKIPELNVAASYIDIKSGESVDVNGDKPFIAASAIKVLVAIDFLHQVELGTYTLDTSIRGDTAESRLQKMITISDNNSWYGFNDLLTYKQESNYAKSLGIHYDSNTNSISTNDMAILYRKLYRYELLNREHTDLLLSFMRKTKIMTLIPGSQIGNASTYNKTGRLDGLIHDASIIDDGTNQFAVIIFSDGTTTLDERAPLFHTITEAFYDFQKNKLP